jgi:hypothetical protein
LNCCFKQFKQSQLKCPDIFWALASDRLRASLDGS